MKTVYINSDNTVVLTCPGCDKAKKVDVSSYMRSDGPISFTYRFQCDACRCGHSSCRECIRENCTLGHVNTVQVERRKTVRKGLSLSGLFQPNAKESIKIKILDISRKGVRVEFVGHILADQGGKGIVDFLLDDPNGTRVRKSARVERCEGKEAVLVFQEDQSFSAADKAIGFYLMAIKE